MTFQQGPIEGVAVRALSQYSDQRGWLVEMFRSDWISADLAPQMAYVSETLPGVARGPHEHRDQTDCFAFVGPGDFRLYLWDPREGSATRGNRLTMLVGESNRQNVMVPPGVVHAYQNVGEQPGWVLNFPNRLYAGSGKQFPVDEIRHEGQSDSPYTLD